MNAQVEELVRSNDHGRLGLSGRLTDGWKRYCLWESLVAAGFAALLSIAAAGVRGWPRAAKIKFVVAALVSVIALNSAIACALLAQGPCECDLYLTGAEFVLIQEMTCRSGVAAQPRGLGGGDHPACPVLFGGTEISRPLQSGGRGRVARAPQCPFH
jgi:hypothetical protein